MLALIALFVYNRPDHLRRTVTSLRENDLSEDSELFIFADGPRNESAAASVSGVREFVRTVSGFRRVIIIERVTRSQRYRALERLLSQKTLHGRDVAPSAGFIREFKKMFLNATTQVLPDGQVVPRKLTVEGLQKLINGRDEIVDKAGGYAGRQLADATNAYVALESRRLMARELYKTAPDLKTVNQAYHYWANATDLLQASVGRKTGQQRTMHNLFKILLGMGGGGAYVSGNAPVLGAATGSAVAGMAELMTTPQWRSVSAHLKKRLANSIERGDWTSAQRIIGRLMAAGSAQATAGSE